MTGSVIQVDHDRLGRGGDSIGGAGRGDPFGDGGSGAGRPTARDVRRRGHRGNTHDACRATRYRPAPASAPSGLPARRAGAGPGCRSPALGAHHPNAARGTGPCREMGCSSRPPSIVRYSTEPAHDTAAWDDCRETSLAAEFRTAGAVPIGGTRGRSSGTSSSRPKAGSPPRCPPQWPLGRGGEAGAKSVSLRLGLPPKTWSSLSSGFAVLRKVY